MLFWNPSKDGYSEVDERANSNIQTVQRFGQKMLGIRRITRASIRVHNYYYYTAFIMYVRSFTT